MDTAGLALPKPRDAKKKGDGTRVTKDGRLIESPTRYRRTKAKMWDEQNGCCAKCGIYMDFSRSERHHPGGRGLGGGKRDDRKTVLWCEKCHTEHHA